VFKSVVLKPSLPSGFVAEVAYPAGRHIAKAVAQSGRFYEHELLERIVKAKIGGVYVDVGAHVGNHAVVFSEACPSSRVIAIEPVEPNVKILRRNVAGLDVTVVPLAVHHDPKVVVDRWEYAACSLDDVIESQLGDDEQVGLVKVDAHPHSVEALASGRRTIAAHRPVVAVEAHGRESYDAVADVLSPLGYVCTGRYCATATYVFEPFEVWLTVLGYERPEQLYNLLCDVARDQRDWVKVHVYDDGSRADMAKSTKLAKRRGWQWTRFAKPHGKKGLWAVYTEVLQQFQKAPPNTLFAFLPDDSRICRGFFGHALRAWNEVVDPKRTVVTLQAERYRDTVPCWTGFQPKKATKRLWQSQWADGVMLCSHAAFKRMKYSIPKPAEGRWRDPNISSGVWAAFSKTLHAAGHRLYRVHESLTVHVLGRSVMHGSFRKEQPITATRYRDGPGRHARLVTTEPIEASLASIPSRQDSLKLVVGSLLPQVDRSQKHGDHGDAGKFFWCASARGYQLTCDDDLVYPADYALELVLAIERYDRKAAVGMHGILLNDPMGPSYYHGRKLIHWRGRLGNDRSVHLLGTGVLGYHASAVKLTWRTFEVPNMADVWMGLACQRQSVPMVCLARNKTNWLKHLKSPWTIYDQQKHDDSVQTRAVRRVKKWRIWKPQ
jgi:hypothetical protein